MLDFATAKFGNSDGGLDTPQSRVNAVKVLVDYIYISDPVSDMI